MTIYINLQSRQPLDDFGVQIDGWNDTVFNIRFVGNRSDFQTFTKNLVKALGAVPVEKVPTHDLWTPSPGNTKFAIDDPAYATSERGERFKQLADECLEPLGRTMIWREFPEDKFGPYEGSTSPADGSDGGAW